MLRLRSRLFLGSIRRPRSLEMRQLALLTVSVLGLAFSGMPVAADSSPEPVAPPVIVIGFVGGFVHGDNLIHSEVQLAAKLRALYPEGVYAESLANHRANSAYPEIVRLLDTNRDGALTPAEKRSARIILYGHSWGASEAVTLARRLQKSGIPVLLTVQVDSVKKRHEDDALIPANVAEAANFYQPDGFLHGRPRIRAADPERTKILGNFRFDYKENPVRCYGGYGWLVRHFARAHAEIECDPCVWNQVEDLIRSNLPSVATVANAPPAPDVALAP
jgi:pimeloyl-ACP methyl ester carboxylesterase